MDIYPQHFTDTNKKDFDAIRAIAQTIPEYVSLIYDGTSHILIEVSTDTITPAMWDAIDEFNADTRSLSIGFARISQDTRGERYV